MKADLIRTVKDYDRICLLPVHKQIKAMRDDLRDCVLADGKADIETLYRRFEYHIQLAEEIIDKALTTIKSHRERIGRKEKEGK